MLKIGWAERDITTYGPAYIPGFFNMRISRGVIDPVFTTALVVEDGNDIAIFLSVDTCVMRSFLLDEIRAKTKRKNPEIPVEKILASAMHQHTAPSHYYDGGEIDECLYDIYTKEEIDKILEGYIPGSNMVVPRDGVVIESSDKYRAFLSDQASDAICEAYASRKESGIAYGYGYGVVAHSRRTVYFDDTSLRPGAQSDPLTSLHGHARMYGETNDDNFASFEAGENHYVNIMYTFDKDKKLTGAIINIPCPSQNSEGEADCHITADYWCDVKKAIRARHGDIFILSQCAAGGDLSPHLLYYKDARLRRFRLKYGLSEAKGTIDEKMAAGGAMHPAGTRVEELERREIGERIASCFDEVLSWAKNDIRTEAEICHKVETVELSRRIITDEEYRFCLDQLEALKDEEYRFDQGSSIDNLDYNSTLKSKRARFMGAINRYKTQKENPKKKMELHAIKIGDIAFASNQFELYMDYMHRIQARSPFEQTFVVQLSGQPGMDGGSYLATERAVENRGYSASMFCNTVSPKGGQELVEATLKALREIK
ncbi:MAG: hypothetical protein GX633_04330 [Clostridiales bacterium]|nr:hypothetical protein [Clostridiales bacterium]